MYSSRQRTKSIAILLTVYNRKAKTLNCLKHLVPQYAGTNYQCDVYLTNDGCDDGTPEAVKEQFPEVNIIEGDGTLYWNRGMYKAWQAASNVKEYDYYLWLNDDTVLNPNAISELLACENNIPSIVCGAICSKIDNNFTYGGKDEKGNDVKPNGLIQACVIINGNCVLVSKKVFEEIGLLDPVFPHAIGDHDYGLRALKSGFRVVTTREYIGFCEKNASLPKWCYQTTPFRQRLRALYSPLGNAHPIYFFKYESRHFGFTKAAKHLISIHLRVLMPSLWK